MNNWDNYHAFVNHLSRANESILLNLAEGCRSHSRKAKNIYIDYSIGSLLESAACMDIAEGNGRFFNQDHAQFISIANKSVTKLIVRLELCSLHTNLKLDLNEIKDLLSAIDKGTKALEERLKKRMVRD